MTANNSLGPGLRSVAKSEEITIRNRVINRDYLRLLYNCISDKNIKIETFEIGDVAVTEAVGIENVPIREISRIAISAVFDPSDDLTGIFNQHRMTVSINSYRIHVRNTHDANGHAHTVFRFVSEETKKLQVSHAQSLAHFLRYNWYLLFLGAGVWIGSKTYKAASLNFIYGAIICLIMTFFATESVKAALRPRHVLFEENPHTGMAKWTVLGLKKTVSFTVTLAAGLFISWLYTHGQRVGWWG